MYTFDRIRKLVFFDIETTAQYETYQELEKNTPASAAAFKYNYTMKTDRQVPGWVGLTLEEAYIDKAPLLPEYGKVICLSWGILNMTSTEDYELQTASIIGGEEQILKKTKKLLKAMAKKNLVLCGQNIKDFDMPYLDKRMMIHGLVVPELLWTADKKPWEISVVDTRDLWSFGSYRNQSNLVETCAALGIPSPKDDIWGSEVYRVFYKDKDIDRIARYCEHDVQAVANIMLKFCGKQIIEDEIEIANY